MGDEVGEVGPEIAVAEHADTDHGHRPAEDASADLQGDDDAGDADQGVELVLRPGPVVEGFELADPVKDDKGRSGGEEDVGEGWQLRPRITSYNVCYTKLLRSP